MNKEKEAIDVTEMTQLAIDISLGMNEVGVDGSVAVNYRGNIAVRVVDEPTAIYVRRIPRINKFDPVDLYEVRVFDDPGDEVKSCICDTLDGTLESVFEAIR
jgi:hypothetical protein